MLFKDTQSKVWWESRHCHEAVRLVDRRRSSANVKCQFAGSVEKEYEAVKAMIEGQLSDYGDFQLPQDAIHSQDITVSGAHDWNRDVTNAQLIPISASAYNLPVLSDPAQVTITFSTQLPEIAYLQLLDKFINPYIPAHYTSYEIPLQWLQSIISMTCEPRALTLAISALGLGWARHVGHRNRCIENEVENYVAAVGGLRKYISRASVEQVLSTILLLTLDELHEFGSEFSRGWVTHLNGIQEDFQNFGPHCSL
ncbi:putative Zn(2)-C6 fungal-type domain-containing protein [Seiridium cardinale]|uniref:Zn(2)-C6 fungal-type domain-containing protein n=1 Tax=Seiridium cardinale TaxID=138064 RepID=A0ABR2XVE6_9PEZI